MSIYKYIFLLYIAVQTLSKHNNCLNIIVARKYIVCMYVKQSERLKNKALTAFITGSKVIINFL